MSIVYLDDGTGALVNKTIDLTGVNLRILNGLDATNGYPVDPDSINPLDTQTNGLGNLIVGYNELGNPNGDDRTGSHNMVVGHGNSYTSFGGWVGPWDNTVSGPFCSVTGGVRNTASGVSASVSGGYANTASGWISSVSGGWDNTASGFSSSVSGGCYNTAGGTYSTVSGGYYNRTSGSYSSVSGGNSRAATGDYDWVAGSLFEDN